MAIILYTGVPGSGKSYRVVYDLLRKGAANKYYVLHNIDGLKPELFETPEYIKDWREVFPEGVDKWVNKACFSTIALEARERFNRPVLLIFDEAQMIFDVCQKVVKEALSWHRHEGVDIWLICQHSTMINPQYRKLCDYEVQAKKCFAVPHFIYKYKVQGVSFRTEKLKKDEAVFACFTSFNVAEAQKGGSRLLYGLPVLAVLGVGVLVWVLVRAPDTFASAGGKVSSDVTKVDSSKVKKVKDGGVRADRAEPVLKVETEKLYLAARFGDRLTVWSRGGMVSYASLRAQYVILDDKADRLIVHALGHHPETIYKFGYRAPVIERDSLVAPVNPFKKAKVKNE